MKLFKLLLFVLVAFFVNDVHAQISGVKNIPGDYASLAAAITALNTSGVGAGGVTINLNQVETAPTGGYILGSAILNASSLSTKPIVINGGNNTITSQTGTSTTSDAVFRLAGPDYVTLNQLKIVENAANTTIAAQMERGIAVMAYPGTVGSQGPNGSQNVTIQGCNISLAGTTQNNSNETGILLTNVLFNNTSAYSTAVVPTSTAGKFDSIVVRSNTITNCYTGIAAHGGTVATTAANLLQTRVVIGGTSIADANTISGYGGQSVAATTIGYGVYVNSVANEYVSYNNLSATSVFSPVNHIHITECAGNIVASNNTISFATGAASTGAQNGVNVTGFSAYLTNTSRCDSNLVQNVTLGGTSVFIGINHNILGLNGTVFYNNHNKVENITRTGTGGNITGILLSSTSTTSVPSDKQMVNNTVKNIAVSAGTAAFNFNGLRWTGTSGLMKGNTVDNINITNSATAVSTVNLINSNCNLATGLIVPHNVDSNIVKTVNLIGPSFAGFGITLINGAAVNNTYSRNIITALSIIGGGTIGRLEGIFDSVNTGTELLNINNNIISNFSVSAANTDNAIKGINVISGGATVNLISHNTIYLGGGSTITSTGTNFGVSGVCFSVGATIKNNIINIAATPNGTGRVAAIRSLLAGTAGVISANFGPNSSNNILYAINATNSFLYAESAVGVAPVVFYNLTNDPNFNTSCSNFKAVAGVRGTNTYTGNNLTLVSTGIYAPTGTSLEESNAVPLASVTTDIFGTTRPSTPDCGALEFSGITPNDFSGPTIIFSKLENSTYVCSRLPKLIATITDISGVNVAAGTKPRIYFKKSTDNDAYLGNTNADNGWKFAEASNAVSPFKFQMNSALLTSPVAVNDTIQYFIVAQDLATSPNIGINQGSYAAGHCPASVDLLAGAFPLQASPTVNKFTINSISNTINQTSKNSYTFNNQTLTQSGIYYDTLTNTIGCDSIVTLNLTIVHDFITLWRLNNPGSSTNSITFGVGTTGIVNYTWETIPAGTTGSGSFSGTTATIAGLPANSIIRLKIDTTNFNRININNNADKSRLVDIEQWGDVSWNSMENAFSGCSNLNISATDVPGLSLVTNMAFMFNGCSSLNSPANMYTWNTVNVTNMNRMFSNATSFNQPIGNWNTSNVTRMDWMFSNATSFNQPIGNWNTSNVYQMSYMFSNATSFNQPIDNWNTSNVISMSYMFSNASSFNQPIGNWDFLDTQHMLDGCGMDCTNYSTTLNGWVQNYSSHNVFYGTLGALGIKYGTNAVSSRNYLINTKGWTINGDIANGFACCVVTSNFSQTTCNSYIFNNQTLTQSGIYYDTLINANGCDSIIILNLTINHPTSITLNQSACDSYFFNNQTITQSGIYYDTLINSTGCDSMITLNLTINHPTSNTINQTACLSYTFNNQTITQSGIYYDTLTNTTGCDSMITLNLTILQGFITRWNLNNSGSSTNSITFGVGTTGTVNYTWETIPAGTTGSGSFSGTTATISGLPTNSTIRLKIDPINFNRININNNADKSRLTDIEQWGDVSWTTMENAFYGCNSLNISATDVPNLSLVTSMASVFRNCSSLNSPTNIDTWNTSNATNMFSMFYNATSFNQPIGNWNTSNVTRMDWMFRNATNFNQPIGNWNTSNVTNMSYLFYMAKNFNQPIGNWNTSNVTNMSYMFYNDTSFNQPIGNWNLSALLNNQTMLDNCGMDCINYSTTLIGWANNINTPNGRTIGASGIKYGTNAVSSRNYLLNTKGWTINGDIANGFACCIASTSNFSQTICNSYFFNNQTLTQSGIYFDTLINANGCDSIITLNLTINNHTSNTINQSACNSYSFNNQTLTQSGIYYDTLINSVGCDSIITLNLTVNLTSSATTNTTICSSALPYSWNGQSLTAAGVYTNVTTGANGCDSTTTLNLTVNATSTATITLSSLAPFSWNGSIYTASGIYTYTTTNAAGCDSVITLNLTSTVTVNVTAFIQGYYNGTSMVAARYDNLTAAGSLTPGSATDVDFVTVELYDAINTAAVAYTAVGMLQSNGALSVSFPGATIGNSYYIVLKHQNSIQLWSANPVTINSTTSYDFSTALTQAYTDGSADPMALLATGVYGMYSGDLNQDEYIDGSDYSVYQLDVDNSTNLGLFNLASDLNGDTYVDGSDYPLFDVNSLNFLYSQHP